MTNMRGRPALLDVHPALLDAACAAARHLVGELPAPSDPRRGGRRQTHLLVIGGIEKVRNGKAGLGKDGGGQIEQLLVQAACEVIQSAGRPGGATANAVRRPSTLWASSLWRVGVASE